MSIIGRIYYLCVEDDIVRYIGQTTQPLNTRLIAHKSVSKLKKVKKHKDHWIIKNWDNIKIKELERVEKDTKEDITAILDEIEIHYIDLYRNNGYNLLNDSNGGGGTRGRIPWNKGIERSEECKKKISNANKGRKPSEDTIKKLIGRKPWNKGISHTEEVKIKIGLTSLGRKHTDKSKKMISDANKGKSYIKTEEHKKKLSISAIERNRLYAIYKKSEYYKIKTYNEWKLIYLKTNNNL